jgi:hypothetical protein
MLDKEVMPFLVRYVLVVGIKNFFYVSTEDVRNDRIKQLAFATVSLIQILPIK